MDSPTTSTAQLIKEYETSEYGPKDACIFVVTIEQEHGAGLFDGRFLDHPMMMHKKTRDILFLEKNIYGNKKSYDLDEVSFNLFKKIQSEYAYDMVELLTSLYL